MDAFLTLFAMAPEVIVGAIIAIVLSAIAIYGVANADM